MKLSKNQISKHESALRLLDKDYLTYDEKLQVYKDWIPAYSENIGVIASYFTPHNMARDMCLEISGNKIIDLCSGIGMLAFTYHHWQNDKTDIVCIERNRSFVEVGKKLLPEAEWRVCRASDVGAPHHRARLYLVSYSNSIRLQQRQTFFSNVHKKASQISWEFAGTIVQNFRGNSWESEPPVLCVDDGISSKLVRQSLHAYGNAVVPQVVYEIFKAINEQIQD